MFIKPIVRGGIDVKGWILDKLVGDNKVITFNGVACKVYWWDDNYTFGWFFCTDDERTCFFNRDHLAGMTFTVDDFGVKIQSDQVNL
jgi:hypothetical protein